MKGQQLSMRQPNALPPCERALCCDLFCFGGMRCMKGQELSVQQPGALPRGANLWVCCLAGWGLVTCPYTPM